MRLPLSSGGTYFNLYGRPYSGSRDLEIRGWTIPAGDKNSYFLSAEFSSPPTNSTPYNSDVWQGSIEFPAVKLSGSMVKIASPMFVGRISILTGELTGAFILLALIKRFFRSKRVTP